MEQPEPAGPPRGPRAGLHALAEMSLRAYDLSERTARRGGRSAVERWERWRSRWFLIAQISVTAGLAWFVAAELLGHETPFFAPVAAIITLGVTFGSRLRRGVEVAIGVAVGVFVGDVFALWFGSGVWQIMIVAALAMSIASLLGAGQLMIIQACVQSAIVITLAPDPSQAFDRWLDAVIGAGLALVMATVAPSAPVRRPRVLAAQVLCDMAATLEAAAQALRAGDQEAADAVLEQARRGAAALRRFSDAAEEGLAVVRLSPFRRHQLPGVMAYAELYEPLDHASRNLRVLARRCAVALWRGEAVPGAYLVLMERLAMVIRFMAGELHARRMPTAARQQLIRIGEESSHLKLVDSISAVVILAQLRSMTSDLLELTGVDYAEARELIPEMD